MRKYLFVLAAGLLGVGFTGAVHAQDTGEAEHLYMDNCASCHGGDLTGGTGSNLVDDEWSYGGDREDIVANIRSGLPEQGMPAFGNVLTDQEIGHLAEFILNAEPGMEMSGTDVPDTLETLDYKLSAEIFADNLEIPWAIDFIDENTALITERPGGLRIVKNGQLRPDSVQGTPEVLHAGQGGLLDVAVDPNYEDNGWVYLSYSHALEHEGDGRAPAMTRIVRGRIEDNRWVDQEVLFEAPHETYRTTRHHYGNRIVFDDEGYLFFSIGDRGGRSHAQDLSRPNGKVHRIHRDGSIPDNNPFVHLEDALPSIYTWGHRNPQGLAVHPETDEVWDAEHGPRGGDELNLLEPGGNYGWPVITYGINYSGTIITRNRHRLGMEQPTYYWRPSIAVCGINYYTGDLFPFWKNHLLVAGLEYQQVRLLNIHEGRVLHEEVILDGQGRVREAVQGSDGAVYVVLNDPGRVLRLTPDGHSWEEQ